LDSKRILEHLMGRTEDLRKMEILTASGRLDERGSQKVQEVAGFCAVVLRYVEQFLGKRERIEILECSCGKSYVGFALQMLLREFLNRPSGLVGVDSNPVLVQKCRELAGSLGREGAEFVCSRTLAYTAQRKFDLVVALHACDIATDQAIAKGIELGAHLILTVRAARTRFAGRYAPGTRSRR